MVIKSNLTIQGRDLVKVIYSIVQRLELSSFSTSLQVVILRGSSLMVLLLMLQERSVLEDQLSTTSEKLLIVIPPCFKLLVQLYLIKRL